MQYPAGISTGQMGGTGTPPPVLVLGGEPATVTQRGTPGLVNMVGEFPCLSHSGSHSVRESHVAEVNHFAV